MNDTQASTIAIIHTSRGLTPPNGPIGSLGTIGNAMKVIPRSTNPDRSSSQVILATHPCSSSLGGDSGGCRDAHVANQCIDAKRKGQHAGNCGGRREGPRCSVLLAA